MGRLFKATYRDRKGRSRESSKWYAEFRDHNETIRRMPTFTSKAAAGEFARNVEKLVGFHRASGGQMDPDLGPWLETLPTAIKAKLVEIGLLDGRRVAIAKTLRDHLDDFAASLKAKGDTSEQVKLLTGRVQRIIDDCTFSFWSDLSASASRRICTTEDKGKKVWRSDIQLLPPGDQTVFRWMIHDL